MVENQGFEPRMPEATDLQSAEVTNASRSPTGSPRWIRTTDLRINSPSLYRLSYQGIVDANQQERDCSTNHPNHQNNPVLLSRRLTQSALNTDVKMVL